MMKKEGSQKRLSKKKENQKKKQLLNILKEK